MRELTLITVGFVTALQVWTLRRASHFVMPFAAMVVLVLNVVGCAGYLFFRDIAAAGAQVSAPIVAGQVEYDSAARVFALASAAVWAGGLVGAIGRRPQVHGPGATGAATRDLLSAASRLPRTAVLMGSTVPLALSIVGIGPGAWISRGFYLESTGPAWMVSLAGALTPVGLAGAALVLFDRERRAGRIWAGLLLIGYACDLLARDTRLLGVMPLIVLGAYLAERRDRRVKTAVVPVAIAVISSVLLLQLTLLLRGQVTGAGLAPYISAIVHDPGSLLDLSSSVGGVVANILFSVPLAGFLAVHVSALPQPALITSLTPLPSEFTAWPQLLPLLRVDVNTPYSTLGELAVYGSALLCSYFAAVGFVVSRLQLGAARMVGLRSVLVRFAAAALVLLFAVTILQYNLRSSTRLVWYAIGIYIVVRLWPGRKATSRSAPADRPSIAAAPRGSPPPAARLPRPRAPV